VDEQPDPSLAVLLKRLREERNISQEQLASDAGITSSALSRIERGLNNPRWTTIKRIAKALEISLVELTRYFEGSDT
jgi:XRE family transcriptional regulator, regulator of sulfur utilization